MSIGKWKSEFPSLIYIKSHPGPTMSGAVTSTVLTEQKACRSSNSVGPRHGCQGSTSLQCSGIWNLASNSGTMAYVWIAIGGALGSVARFWFSGLVARHFGETFPWGTLLVN